MHVAIDNPGGGYAYIPALPFASAGVVALPGMGLVHAVFTAPRPWQAGFEAVRRHLESVHRPLTALCGFEFRMPAVLSLADFMAFNTRYQVQLESWDLIRDAAPTLARTNVVSVGTVLSEDALYGFSYSIEAQANTRDFVISGTPEITSGGNFPGNIVRRGESSEDALRDKTRCAVSNVRRITEALGASWEAACSVHLYSRWPLERALRSATQAELGVTPIHGVVCHDAEPPIFELALEVDVRRYQRELMLS